MRQSVFVLAVLLSACTSACASASSTDTAEPAPEAQGSSHQLDPGLSHLYSLHGTVSDSAGKPLKGSYLTIIRKDTGPEKNLLDADGRYLLHVRPENSGPPPWEFVYGAPGYAEQTRVVEAIPEAGVQIDIKLVAKD